MRDPDIDTMTATARLPTLDIEIVHRRMPEREAEQLSINLRATPSFEAFGRFLDAANPWAFWAQASRLVWLSWMDALMLPTLALQPPLPRARLNPGATPSGREPR